MDYANPQNCFGRERSGAASLMPAPDGQCLAVASLIVDSAPTKLKNYSDRCFDASSTK